MRLNPKKTSDPGNVSGTFSRIGPRGALYGWAPTRFCAVVALVALWAVPLPAQEMAPRLLWNSGDVLPGQPTASTRGQVGWRSPHFLDPLVIEQGALDRVIFPKPQPDQLELTGAFRIDTVSGDFWTADLVGADQETFLFFNKRFGRVRVRRDAVYTMERREHPNLVFASSRSMTDWQDGSGWQLNNRGQLETHLPRSQMFRAVTWPERLKIDLALESTKNRLAFILPRTWPR